MTTRCWLQVRGGIFSTCSHHSQTNPSLLPTSATPKQLICPEKQGLTQSITETGRVDSNTQPLNSAITCQQPKPLQQPRHCLTRLIPRPAAWERRTGRQEKTREESVNFIYFLREQKVKEEGLEKERREAGHCVMGCTFAQSTRSKIKSIQASGGGGCFPPHSHRNQGRGW